MILMLEALQARLGYNFTAPERLRIALTHRSYHFENKQNSQGHFERLEFLGDAVLDLVLSESLMAMHPHADEGTLSKWRASLVNETTLSEIAKSLNLSNYLFLGRSEQSQLAGHRPRLLASALEAVFAAIYQDGGLPAARTVIENLFRERLEKVDHLIEFATDFKTRLQEYSQRQFRTVPDYRLKSSAGPEHAKTFRYEVWIGEQAMGEGEGPSRKGAEQDAAHKALIKIEHEKGAL